MCIRRSATMVNWKSFVVVCTILEVVTNSFSGYTISVLTAIEKQFALPSSRTGLMLSSQRVGYLLFLLVGSYIGGRWHLPRILGVAHIITGAMVITIATTRFIVPWSDAPSAVNTSDDSPQQFCHDHQKDTAGFDDTMNIPGFAVFYVAYAIIGAVSIPMSTLLPAYLEDIIPKQSLPAVFGVTGAVGSSGVFIGFSVGSWCNSLYVTLKGTQLRPTDPAWIGAWWLGFYIFGCLYVVFAFLMFIFPKHLQREEPDVQEDSSCIAIARENELAVDNDTSDNEITRENYSIKGLPRTIWRLFSNKVVLIFVCLTIISSFNDSGPWNFMLKYFVDQFHVPAWKVNLMFGVGGWLTMSVSAIVGGFIATKFRLSFNRALILCIVCGSCVVAVRVGSLFVKCDQKPVWGVNSSDETPVALTNPCNQACNCTLSVYTPVCDGDFNYFSACHAGCNSSLSNGPSFSGKKKTYADCACTESGRAVDGLCPVSCPVMLAFFVVAVLPTFFWGVTHPPNTVNILRSVERRDKAITVATIKFAGSLIGDLTAPSLTGEIIDSSCLVSSGGGGDGNCWIYEYYSYRTRVMGMSLALAASSVLLLSLMYRITRRDPEKWVRPGQ